MANGSLSSETSPGGQSSTFAVADFKTVNQQVQASIADWDNGYQGLATVLVQALRDASNSPGPVHMVLVHAFESLVTSPVEVDKIVTFYNEIIDNLDEEGKEKKLEVLAEAMADTVETVNEEVYKESLARRSGVDAAAADKSVDVLRDLLSTNRLSRQVANLVLSPELLERLKSLPPGLTPARLDSLRTKANTQSFYKLPLFNLLRESSEGYASIITILTSDDTLDPSVAGLEDDRKEAARNVWSNINTLIGYYGLAPARVLDIILEVASCQVADHWRFFLSLIKVSPWGSSPFSEADDNVKAEGDGLEEGALDQPTLIRVICAKFRLFQRPTLDSGADLNKLPLGFVYFVALLVKHGFLSLANILGAITPDDEGMKAIYEKWEKAMSSGSGSTNKLALAGALVDEDAPVNSDTAAEGQQNATPPRPPPEHRIVLLQALLAIGDMHDASYLISRYPWVVQTHASIADLIMRNVNYALEPVYHSIENPHTFAAPTDVSRDNIPVVQTLWVPSPPDTLEKSYRFFYPAWNAQQKQWHTIDELVQEAWPILGQVRSMAIRNNQAIIRICRIGARYFESLRKERKEALGFGKYDPKDRKQLEQLEPTQSEMDPWIRIIRLCLLPALSVSQSNTAFDVELWAILKHFPYRVRHVLYRDWRDNTCRTIKRGNPCLPAAHASSRALSEAKSVLKNITSQKQGSAGHEDVRAITVLTNIGRSNPLPLWERAIYQVKSYANIGEHIVTSARNMGFLSMDVAAFVILDELDSIKLERATLKGSVAAHLENIATFIAQFNRRYRMMDLEPVLDFIVARVNAKRYDDLVILDQIITLMTGSTRLPDDAFSDDQLRAFAADDELQKESITQTTISIIKRLLPDDPLADAKRREALKKPPSVKNSLPKLVEALKDPNFGVPIFLGLAKTYQHLATTHPHVSKNARLGQMDVIRHILHQYADAYAAHIPAEHLAATTPSIESLVAEQGIDTATAFKIVRPVLRAIFRKEAEESAAKSQSSPLSSETKTTEDAKGVSDKASPAQADLLLANGADGDVPMDGPDGRHFSTESSRLQVTFAQAANFLKSDVALTVRAPYFVTFWYLCLRDVEHSAEAYDKEIKRLRLQANDVGSWRDVEFGDPVAERDRLRARADLLDKERAAHAAKVAQNLAKLKNDSESWFTFDAEDKASQSALIRNLVEECFIPRALFGPEDAVFVAKFIGITHDLAPAYFSTAAVYAKILGPDLEGWISTCTNNEARNLGRCLRTILDVLDEWHSQKRKYDSEALGTSAFGRKRIGFTVTLPDQDKAVDMTWEMFCNYYAKRHESLSDAISKSLRSDDPMHVKNALIISLQIMRSFPVMEPQGVAITEAVEYAKNRLDGMQYPDVLAQLNGFQKQLESSRKRAMAIKSFSAGNGESDTWLTPTRFHQNGRKTPQEKQRLKQIEEKKRKAEENKRKAAEAKSQSNNPAPTARTSARNPSAQDTRPTPPGGRPARPDSAEIKARTAKAINDAASQPSSLPARPGDGQAPASRAMGRPETRSSAAPSGPHSSRHASPSPALPAKPGAVPPARPANPSNVQAKIDHLKAERESAQQSRFQNLSAPTPPKGPSATRNAPRSAAATPAPGASTPGPQSSEKRRPVTPPLPENGPASQAEDGGKRTAQQDAPGPAPSDSHQDPAASNRSKRPPTPELPDSLAPPAAAPDRKEEEDRLRAKEEQTAVDAGRAGRGDARAKDERDKEKDRDGKQELRLKRKRDDEPPRRVDDPRDRERERDRDRDRAPSSYRSGENLGDDRRDSRDDRREERKSEHRTSRRDERERDRDRSDRDRRDRGDRDRHRRDRSRESERSRRDRTHHGGLSRDRDAGSSRRSSPESKDRSEREARAARFGGGSADDREKRNGDRTPSVTDTAARGDNKGKELFPARPPGERIIEAPRSTRAAATPRVSGSNDHPVNGRQPHDLPSRPGRPVTPPLDQPSGLAARLGPARDASSSAPRNGDASPGSLKRRGDDGPKREESPAEGAKRPKLDRSRLRRMM